MPRQWSGRVRLVAVGALALTLTACAKLPPSVVEGSVARVGWSQDLTSTNAASQDGATVGNLDVAAMTRSQFAQVIDGDVVLDDSFGRVKVLDQDPFTVRYDLAEPAWSDGIPLDAADLLLAWAAGSNALVPDAFDSMGSGLSRSTEIPEYHEFARRIDVSFSGPVVDWQTALDVAVPAHVVGRLALDVDDPMEAKQAVITAIRKRDRDALAAITQIWNTGFAFGSEGGSDVPPELLLSSGPYRVERVDRSDSATRPVRLVVNKEYAGAARPAYEHVELVRPSSSNPLADLEGDLDVVQVAPTVENRRSIRELERRDYDVSHAHDGTVWVLALRADRGVFRERAARLAFLRAVPLSDLRAAGAGPWREAFATSQALLFPPRARGYQIALEDAGFRTVLDARTGEAAAERSAAGVRAGTPVCVLYDTDETFAQAAFAELRSGVREAGWRVRDCGAANGPAAAAGSTTWHAVLTAVPVPHSPEEITATWGSEGLGGLANEARDGLVAELGQTSDTYAARDLRVLIEATLVADALAVPLALPPVLTVARPDIEGVRPRSGRSGSLTSGVSAWAPVGN